LKSIFPQAADELFGKAEKNAKDRYDSYRRLAEQKYE